MASKANATVNGSSPMSAVGEFTNPGYSTARLNVPSVSNTKPTILSVEFDHPARPRSRLSADSTCLPGGGWSRSH